jgi:hypothetical protein
MTAVRALEKQRAWIPAQLKIMLAKEAALDGFPHRVAFIHSSIESKQ